jgi:exodeoxyribonuclease VIII
MELSKSPKKYWHKYHSGKYEQESTEALEMGSAFHCLILEPEKFKDYAAIVPDDKKKLTKAQINAKNPSDSTRLLAEWWGEFDKENEGKAYLKQQQAEQLRAMADAIRKEPAAQKLLGKKGLIEPSIFWTDEETNIDIKVKLDFVPTDNSFVCDIKTAASVDENKFMRSIGDYGYDIQAFMNIEAIFQLTGERPDAFIWACVEKAEPYDTGFFVADDTVLQAGEVKFRYLLRKLAECRLNDRWPSRGDGKFRPIGMPPWEMQKLEEMETE